MKTHKRAVVLEFDRASLDGDSRSIDVSFSSDTEKVGRWFGVEVLRHTSRSVDLSRLRDVGALLFNHDPNRIVGGITNPRVESGKLRATITFDETEEGELRRSQVKSGSLRGASLAYTYGADDFDEVQPGKTRDGIAGPARIVKRWTPHEVTLTPIPADTDVGVGRSDNRKGQNMKWEAVVNDGELIRRFPTKKAAQEFADEQEDEAVVRRVTVEKDGERSEEIPATKPDGDTKDPIDIESVRREAGTEAASRFGAILDAATMAGDVAFGRSLWEKDSKVTLADATRQIHERWAKSQKDKNPSTGQPEPSTNNKRTLQSIDDDVLVTNLTRRTWTDIGIEEMPDVLRVGDLRDMIRVDNGRHFEKRVQQLFTDKKLTPQSFSLKAVHQALGDVNVSVLRRDDHGGMRALTTSAFAVITGSTLIAMLRDAYDSVATIGEQLTTRMDSSNAVDTIPAVLTQSAIDEVQEGREYPHLGAVEEYVTISHKKQGAIIDVTRETIQFDQTGQFLTKANVLVTDAIQKVEKLTLEAVTAKDTSAWRPAGTATALYSTSAKDRGTNQVNSNALVDSTDLDNARAKLAAMTKHNGDPALALPRIILVPDALIGAANKILGSEMTPGTENEMNPWGPRGQWQPIVLTSPWLDTFTNGTSNWYLGEPAKQFIRKQVFGIETSAQGGGSDAAFETDVVFRGKVAFDIAVGAIDYVFFVKSQSGA